MDWTVRRVSGLTACVILALVARPAGAHPLGNSSITHFNVLYVLSDRIQMDLWLDFAETPAGVLRRDEIDANRDGEDTPEEQQAWLDKMAGQLAPRLEVTLDGHPVALAPMDTPPDPKTGSPAPASRVILKIPGALGMPTYRLIILYGAKYPAAMGPGEHVIAFKDCSFPANPGLRRILLERTPDVEFIGTRPPFVDEGESPFIYEQYDPGNLPNESAATIRFRAVTQTPAVPPAHREQFTDPRNDPAKTAKSYRQAGRLIGLLQGRWGIAMFLTVTALAFGWGAAHALMPGHAKTVVAAYLISRRGSYWHAVVLAIVVTITHTALVVILGMVIWVYQARHPTLGANMQLWLGAIAGILVAVMGLSLIWRAIFTGRHHYHDEAHDQQTSWWRRLLTHSHPKLPSGVHNHTHPHEHDDQLPRHEHAHDHHDHAHEHEHVHAHADDDRALSLRMVLLLGITGGIVPCPTATIIMLLGIGANVVKGALYAVAVFSLGLALTLMAIGFLALSSRRFAAKLLFDAEHEGQMTTAGQRLLLQVVPAASGLAVVALGSAIAAHYLYMLSTGRSLFPWLV